MKPLTAPDWFRPRLAWSAAAAAWAALLIGGFGALMAFEFRRGEQATPPAGCPVALAHWLGDRPFHLVMALHPKCPCSRASVAELERLSAKCNGEFDCIVLLSAPPGAGDDWLQAPLVHDLHDKLDATIVHDVDSALAEQLGMHTSGAVVLLGKQGQTCFFGGVTASRGHEGDSEGSDAIRDIVSGQKASAVCSPVFGCPLVH